MAVQPNERILKRVRRLKQILDESTDIIERTKNRDTKLSRIDVAIKTVIELKGILDKYRGIEMENIYLIDYQLTKMKYEMIRDQLEG